MFKKFFSLFKRNETLSFYDDHEEQDEENEFFDLTEEEYDFMYLYHIH
ncbi:hypothetical protein ACQKP0_00920 [Heyndrickxia sp. NPDC080065]